MNNNEFNDKLLKLKHKKAEIETRLEVIEKQKIKIIKEILETEKELVKFIK